MSQVVNGEGTARSARMNVPDVLLAGKTGTAQVRRITMAERAGGVRGDAALPFKLRDHSLFQGFAPANNPRYAASCILEHSGHMATAARTEASRVGKEFVRTGNSRVSPS